MANFEPCPRRECHCEPMEPHHLPQTPLVRADRVHHVGDGRQRLIFHLDESDSFLGDVAAVRHHQRCRLVDMAHFAECDAALLLSIDLMRACA
jgi:hypothetical protein